MLQLAARNTERAKQIVQATDIINIWKSIGAEINLVGSLKMGLMMKHRDIDFPAINPGYQFPSNHATGRKPSDQTNRIQKPDRHGRTLYRMARVVRGFRLRIVANRHDSHPERFLL